MSKHNPVGWFELYVQDMQRARAFYEAVLNTTLTEIVIPDANIEMWGFPQDMEATGSSGALMKVAGVSSGGGGTLIYFNCENCATEAARVEANGGEVLQAKMAVGEYGFVSLIIDTEGNRVGLFSNH
ncbi:VOC family protein [Marinicella sediminis]|uniref:VOC family protein n=1 Tax=Marinicella sediminis TaxID=1792834 RepID=A0ABV7JAF4_9GAMM|nr:VOC family protein [Marinicella sediminis]